MSDPLRHGLAVFASAWRAYADEIDKALNGAELVTHDERAYFRGEVRTLRSCADLVTELLAVTDPMPTAPVATP